jgi:hypothetical protein
MEAHKCTGAKIMSKGHRNSVTVTHTRPGLSICNMDLTENQSCKTTNPDKSVQASQLFQPSFVIGYAKHA